MSGSINTEVEIDLTKAVAGEFYLDEGEEEIEEEDQFHIWHVMYESSIPKKHKILLEGVVKNKDDTSRKICRGYAIINGKREFITVVKFPK